MSGRYILGLDGGQTSTQAALCDDTGALLGVGHAGPANHVHEPGGLARLERALHESALAAFADGGLEPAPLAAACCGLTGVGQAHVAALWPAEVPAAALVVEHDSVAAHAGALAGEPGAIVIAGTGSVALGVNAAGERARVGGWSHIMGDEGSAYDLGRQALVAAARAHDGRGPATSLLGAILQHCHAQTLWEVHAAVHGGEIDRAGIAQLARLVVAAAVGGDAVAQGIVERGARELSEAAAAVLRRVGLLEQEAAVAPVGGLWRAGQVLLEPFSRHLAAAAPRAVVRPPLYPPALGAIILALRAAGIAMDDGVRRKLAAASLRLAQDK